VGSERRSIVAEVQGGASGEQQRDRLLAGRIVVEFLCELERDAEPRSGVGEVAFGMGSEPDEQLCEHAQERGFHQCKAARNLGDRDGRLLVTGVGGGEAGEVEHLQGALSIERRDLPCRAKEKLARVGWHAAGHLDQTEEAVQVRALDRL
jgi:hypothetical protein